MTKRKTTPNPARQGAAPTPAPGTLPPADTTPNPNANDTPAPAEPLTIEALLADAKAALDAIPAEREQIVATFNIQIGALKGKEETLKITIDQLTAIIGEDKPA